MVDTPWVVQTTKRKRPSTEPPTKKRVRISDDVGRKQPSGKKSRNQQTLTQIQWVNSPQTSFENDADMQEIGLEPGDDGSKGRAEKRGTGKRDSTLTQMDWLDNTYAQRDILGNDLAMLPVPSNANKENIMPQLDGAYDTPRNPKKRKFVDTPQRQRGLSERLDENGRQRHSPAEFRHKSVPAQSQSGKTRRRSTRIASKAPVHVDEHPKPLEPGSTLRKTTSTELQPEAMLNSSAGHQTEVTEDDHIQPIQDQPQTPRRRREVPSSQTPETVSRVSSRAQKIRNASPSKTQTRRPLHNKTNVTRSDSYSRGLKASSAMVGSPNKSPRRSKICVLKLPSKELLRRSGRREDTEHDVFSLPATSSSSEANQKSDIKLTAEVRHQNVLQHQESLEIPATSEPAASSDTEMPSSPPVVETQGSLPELSDLIPSRVAPSTAIMDAGQETPHYQAGGHDSVLVHDFGRTSQNKPQNTKQQPTTGTNNAIDDADDEMLLDNDVHVPELEENTVSAKLPDDIKEDESDFGSPVGNDTQFNIDLQQRMSSPTPAIAPTHQAELQEPTSISGSPTPKRMKRTPLSAGQKELDIETRSPVPTPRLVQNRDPPTQLPPPPSHEIQTTDAVLPSSDSYETVSTVPLSDAVRPPSSPPMQPPAKPITQWSIHPASMPRPSQISTQAPTQIELPSSAPAATQAPSQVERILIKDSNSVPPRLSQIPSYYGKSQGQGKSLVSAIDSDDEIDDLDLDPVSSARRPQQSARKRYNLPRKETSSSLKSIHLPIAPILKPTSQRTEPAQDQPSSPPLEPILPSHDDDTHTIKRSSNTAHENVLESDLTSSSTSSPSPSLLKKKYDPIPGFDNDTQSNFTQDGHITAAYVHREREAGRLPDWFTPLPHQIPNFQGRAKDRRRSGGRKL